MKKLQKKPTNPAGGIKHSVCGEWFPETYPARRNMKWSKGAEDPLTSKMRLFCACTRWAFNRLLEGDSRKELKKQSQQVFGLDSRYCDDAILKAAKITGSQKELLAKEIETTQAQAKLSQAERKLDGGKGTGGKGTVLLPARR